VFAGAVLGLSLGVVGALGLMLEETTRQSLPALRHGGLGFVTSTSWAPDSGEFGALSFVYGTVVTSALALAIAVPLAVGVALFLTELAPARARAVLAGAVDLLAAVPSVVYGLWGVLVLAPWLGAHVWAPVSRAAGGLAPFAGPATGSSYATAAIVLAIMTLPIVSALTREVVATVPRSQREAALALGATRWEVVRLAVLPHARAGIIGAVMLGLGRALGETIAVALVIGSSTTLSGSLFHPGYTMAGVIANEFPEATGAHVGALVAIGVLLFAITLVVNLAARGIVRRAERRLR
jgi:phosphate transport system permease protein